MNKIIKRIGIWFGGLFFFLVLAVILIPIFVDINHYKPMLEKKISETTGRTLTLGGDIKLSVFPWIGISLSDLHFANPKGFSEKDMISVDDFKVKVKLLPLLSKNIEVKEFVLDGARVILETGKDGRNGWQDLITEKDSSKESEPAQKQQNKSQEKGLPISDLKVATFAITNSSLLWLDLKNDMRKEVSGFELTLTDLSFDRPIGMKMAATLDKYPLALEGTIGPVGKEPGKGDLPINISLNGLDLIKTNLKGTLYQPAIDPKFDLALTVESFPPKKLLEVLEQPLPIEPADAGVLNSLALNLKVTGNTKAVNISNGKLVFDDSNLTFSAEAKEFLKPDVAFDFTLDQIDLDRYLPVPSESESKAETKTSSDVAEDQTPPQKIDYTPLRKLVLDGKIGVKRLKVKNVKAQNVTLKVTAKNGVLALEPFSMDLYGGKLRLISNVNVQKQAPKTNVKLGMKDIQAGALIGDFLEKDIIEGTLQSSINLDLTGDTADQVRKTISGGGNLEFANGAIKGVDLSKMVHNTAAAFGLTEKGKEAPETEFTELNIPFKLAQGKFTTQNTRLASPVLKLTTVGNANLVDEKLNFRIEPKFVSPLKGTDDNKKSPGILVPVLVSGTFKKPKFKPDLKAALKQNLGVDIDKKAEKLKKDIEKDIRKGLKKTLSGDKGDEKLEKTKEKLTEEAQKIFKGLPFSK